jgi:thimet oligopeptidase
MKPLFSLSLALLLVLSSVPARSIDVAKGPGALPHAAPAAAPRSATGLSFKLTPAQIGERYAAAQARLSDSLTKIIAIPADQRTFDNTMLAYETAGAEFGQDLAEIGVLSNVSPDAAVQEAAVEAIQKAGKFGIELNARADLYQAFKEYADKGETLPELKAKLLKDTMRGFKSGGHGLTPEDKARLNAVQARLNDLQSDFRENVKKVKDTLELDVAELAGLPDALKQQLLKGAKDGKVQVPLDEVSFVGFMTHAESAGARQRLQLLFNNRARDTNLPIFKEILEKRHELAGLLRKDDGTPYANYAEITTENRLAKTPKRVLDFLQRVYALVLPRGQRDYADLLEYKRRDDPTATKIEPFERDYYAEKLKKDRFGVEEEEVKKYFPVDKVVEGTLKVYQKILNVKFTELAADDVWHKDVRLFRIDSPEGKLIGHFYLDLFPHDGKPSSGAYMSDIIKGRVLPDGAYQTPTAMIVANLAVPQEGKPALLKHRAVETFFHEFGHLMHETLTTAEYASYSGANVPWDGVETPSQMLENMVLEREVLDLISGHYEDGKPLPDDLYKKMLAARSFGDFGKGLHYLRQVSFAMIDMMFHMAVPKETTEMFNRIASMIQLIELPAGSHYEASFGHIAGGYGAGYYSYLWAEVPSFDIFGRFKKEGLFNPKVGNDWRKVLSAGGTRDLEALFAEFLGRPYNEDAFRKALEGEKPSAAERQAYLSANSRAVEQANKLRGVLGIKLDHDGGDYVWTVVVDVRMAESVREGLTLPGKVVLDKVQVVGAAGA